MFISGYASTQDLDHYRHVVVAGAFDESIKAKGLGGPKGIKLLHQHQMDRVIGRISRLATTGDRLWLEGDIDENISYGKDTAAMINANGGLSFSVGFMLEDADIGEDPQGNEYLIILKGELVEVSVVTEPANAEAAMIEYGAGGQLGSISALVSQMKAVA